MNTSTLALQLDDVTLYQIGANMNQCVLLFQKKRCTQCLAMLIFLTANIFPASLKSTDGAGASSAEAKSGTPRTVKIFSDADNQARSNHYRNTAILNITINKLGPLHTKLGKPGPRDWLANHKEPGQTFQQYVQSKPVTPSGKRSVIYVQPLGEFDDKQRKIVELSAEYLSIYFNRSVTLLEDLPLSVIPSEARRVHPQWKVKQILSTHVLYDVLKPRLPKDAAAYIAFTATDLWPGRGWNFVFGQASLRDRVGVWSIHRNGNPTASKQEFKLTLIRTLKTATHETGHMFSIRHCTAYECNMCGSNHREESDRHPLFLCPECHAKICWATATDPRKRYQRLAEFCEKHGLDLEQAYFKQARLRLTR